MFTGIVKEIGTITSVTRASDMIHLSIDCPVLRPDLNLGDSVAIDGCDLTVTWLTGSGFTADATKETLSLTTMGDYKSGSKVNLEPSLTPSTPISGHFVLGHIDGVGTIRSFNISNDQAELIVEAPKDLMKFIARKGSITVSGIGLTVVNVTSDTFSCWIVPYTLEHTTLGNAKSGTKVNLEIDVLARYIIRALESGVVPDKPSKITQEFLKEHGF